MWTSRNIVWTTIAIFALGFLSGCDTHEYNGMDSSDALNASISMDLEESYHFYMETYRGTNPPMVQVAETFKRFGPRGVSFIEQQAVKTGDHREFEADLVALAILDAGCSSSMKPKIAEKSARFGLDKRYLHAACGK
jgi:hypothetical protein